MHPQPPPPPSAAAPAPPLQQHQQHQQTQPSGEQDSRYQRHRHHRHHHQGSAPPERGSKGSTTHAHDSVISHPLSPKPSSPPSPSSSLSSVGRKQHSLHDIQQAPPAHHQLSYPPRAYIDPEKGRGASQPSAAPTPNRVSSSPHVTAIVYDSGDYNEKGPEEKPWQLLFFLSGPCALLSLAITIWTIFALFIALLLQPLRLVSARPSLSSQLVTFLAPPLNLQLHLVYSSSSATSYSPCMLVVIHLISPLVAFYVAIASWTAAFFWFFSAILGDPAGQDGRNDGKESILGVRNHWDRWLSRALR